MSGRVTVGYGGTSSLRHGHGRNRIKGLLVVAAVSYRFHGVLLLQPRCLGLGPILGSVLWRGLVALVLALAWGGLLEADGSVRLDFGAVAQAQALSPAVRDPFLADPLADNPRDPLLPTPRVDRPLSPLELFALEQDLNQLAQAAAALAEADDPEAAQVLWMREVRLRRVLGLDAELEAIDRVARWLRDQSATQSLQLLAARLDQIAPGLDPAQDQDRERLGAITATYTTLGKVEAAAALRRTLAEAALERGEAEEHQAHLEALALTYADWFYFPEAAATYGELVALVAGQESVSSRDHHLRFLVGQIDNLEAAQQYEAALAAQQQLLLRYRAEEIRWPQMAALQYAMAANHQRLGDLDLASRQYQTAYSNAIAGQQWEIAAQALRALADLYRQLEQWPDVDYLYQQLLTVERQALDAYGLMDAFDHMGQLYERTDNSAGALQAYQEGLALAHQLHHRQAYFAAQIQRLSGNAWIDSTAQP